MKIKLVSNKQFSKFEANFGPRVCYRDLHLGHLTFRTISNGVHGTQYASIELLEESIVEGLLAQRVVHLIKAEKCKQ